MHLSPFFAILPSLLPLLASAESPKFAGFRPSSLETCPDTKTVPPHKEHGKEPKNGITGDILSVTRCYCEAPTFDRWGYYLQANYTNYHIGRTYEARYLCTDDARSGHNVPKCWDAHKRENEIVCDADEEENEFCYAITYKHNDNLFATDYMKSVDTFSFNSQVRDVPHTPNERPAPDACNDYCWEWLDGMNVARDGPGDHWQKTLDLPRGLHPKVCSHSEVYTDLDDMCWRCKKKDD